MDTPVDCDERLDLWNVKINFLADEDTSKRISNSPIDRDAGQADVVIANAA